MTAEMTRRAVVAALGAAAGAPYSGWAASAGAAASGAGFPEAFVFGVAASSAQTESRQGRGRSNWDVFADTPGKIRDGSTNARCTEFDTRYGQDIALMAGAGVQAFRFSIAWPRIQPDGPGAPSAAGLDLYDRIVDAMLAAGQAPWPTLFHWDSPVWAGDLRARDMAQRMADYADLVVARLGDRIDRWILLNEPNVVAVNGYLTGSHAPGLRDASAAMAAFHHQNLAQGLMARAVRARLGARARIGSAVSLAPIVAASPAPADTAAAAAFKAFWAGSVLDPMFGRGYPASVAALMGPLVKPGDLEIAAIRPDFLGVNYYARTYIKAGGPPFGIAPAPAPAGTVATAMFNFEPAGLTEILLEMAQTYRAPLVVTETGFAEHDPPPAQGLVPDQTRIEHLAAYVAAAREAIARGADVRGLFYWAATDNWEWAEGFTKRFGLVAVDPTSQQRTPKASLAWYGALARAQRTRAGPA